MTDRPYVGFSDLELRDLERNLDKWARKWSKEDNRFWNEGIVSDRSWETNEEYQNILRNKEHISEQKRKLYEEIAIRRKIRTE